MCLITLVKTEAGSDEGNWKPDANLNHGKEDLGAFGCLPIVRGTRSIHQMLLSSWQFWVHSRNEPRPKILGEDDKTDAGAQRGTLEPTIGRRTYPGFLFFDDDDSPTN